MDDAILDADAVRIMRDRAREGLGMNCTFVDDDMNLLVALAQRAVLAGLAIDARPHSLRQMEEAASKHRKGHETALGFKIRRRRVVAVSTVN